MNDKLPKSVKQFLDHLTLLGKGFLKYLPVVFVVFVVSIYGFVLYQVHTLDNAQPFESEVNQQVKAADVPHIDQNVVKQIQKLQDNSVNVQTLFEQARTNPFQ